MATPGENDGGGSFLHPDLLFRAATGAVLPAWGLLLVSPGSRTARVYSNAAVCFVATLYIYSLVNGGHVEGASFVTLEGVMNIFQRGNAFVLNGCWLHYLALDLATAMVVTKDSLSCGYSRVAMAPVVIAILMFGPAGYLAYQLLQAAAAPRKRATQ